MTRCFSLALALLVLVVPCVCAEEPLPPVEVAKATIEQMKNLFSETLSATNALGTPVAIGDLTLVPVFTKGLGFGMGTGFVTSEENDSADKGKSESNKDRIGMGCGGGGFLKPCAILIVPKSGPPQIMSLNEGALAQVVKALVPVIQKLLANKFELQKLKMGGGNQPSQPPAPTAPR